MAYVDMTSLDEALSDRKAHIEFCSAVGLLFGAATHRLKAGDSDGALSALAKAQEVIAQEQALSLIHI